ncbi:MAG: FimV/HubP family polar landmark protein [Burkholderiales bacterium]
MACATGAHAAGLGRLAVLSALGQPLLAEIEIVSLQAGEEEGLSARIASPEAFQQAGIEPNPSLNGVRITIDRREKRPYLRVTTSQPISEPFLDLLIELQWTGGRLVREYTFLLDPPEYRSRDQALAAAPPAPAAQKPAPVEEEKLPPLEEEKPAAAAPAAPAPTPEASPATAQAAEAAPSSAPAAPEAAAATPAKPEGNTYEVKRGDTLGTIARTHLRPGVSLNQMLVAIFRANEDAFIRGNVNLVRTGKILNIPEPDNLASIDAEDADRIVKEHHAQFMEYRSRLAATVASGEATSSEREASGRIEEKPQAPKPSAPADELRLSKTEPTKGGPSASRAARDDDAAARERALAEAQSRIGELERNIADQKKLLEMRNQQLAELQKKEGAKPAAQPPVAQAPVPTPPAPAAQAPAAPAASTPAAKTPEKPAAEAPKPAAPPPAAPSAPSTPAAQVPEAAKPPAAAPAPKPAAEAPKAPAAAAKPAAKKAPPPEPSLLDELVEDPLYVALLGALVLLLVVYGVWRWRRKKKAQTSFQDSVFGAAAASGAGSLGGASGPSTTSTVAQTASQAPAGMDAEEVDPIAEADVYMAYGRDAQAEEILKDALHKDASRVAVHAKLLEIYAHRKDTAAFEQTALKLKNLTKGGGAEWEKAAALGRSIDAGNGLYGNASEGSGAPLPVSAPSGVPVLDFDVGGASQAASTPDISLDEPAKDANAVRMDLDLGTTQTQKLPATDDETVAMGKTEKSGGGFDFDLDLDGEGKKPQPYKPAATSSEASELDFDLNLDGDKEADATRPEAPKVDLASISLDLDNVPGDTGAQASGDPKWQEVATKLDLAKAYEEMGDKDGARELLKEVMKDGDNAQRGNAEQLLAKLG